MENTILSFAGASRQVFLYINTGVHLLGIGQTQSANLLPSPNPFAPDVPDLIGYVKVKRIEAVLESNNGSIITSKGVKYATIDSSNTENIVSNFCNTIYLETFIDHFSLPPDLLNYSAVGIYTDCLIDDVFNSTLNDNSFIPKNKVTKGYLDIVQNFPSVTKMEGVIHRVQIIKRIN